MPVAAGGPSRRLRRRALPCRPVLARRARRGTRLPRRSETVAARLNTRGRGAQPMVSAEHAAVRGRAGAGRAGGRRCRAAWSCSPSLPARRRARPSTRATSCGSRRGARAGADGDRALGPPGRGICTTRSSRSRWPRTRRSRMCACSGNLRAPTTSAQLGVRVARRAAPMTASSSTRAVAMPRSEIAPRAGRSAGGSAPERRAARRLTVSVADITTALDHAAPNCARRQTVKTVLAGRVARRVPGQDPGRASRRRRPTATR